ncbi:unnamed protein product [Timema podura]|uniref:Uncharacterized protein n=1 Tax=Timema podura TaxID=61482 RepID=A0ABN7PAG8_TIMPD|nr:unnamed protein product [Timema podura]
MFEWSAKENARLDTHGTIYTHCPGHSWHPATGPYMNTKHVDPLLASLVHSRTHWSTPGLAGPLAASLVHSRTRWSTPGLAGPILDSLVHSRTHWSTPGLAGPILDSLVGNQELRALWIAPTKYIEEYTTLFEESEPKLFYMCNFSSKKSPLCRAMSPSAVRFTQLPVGQGWRERRRAVKVAGVAVHTVEH